LGVLVLKRTKDDTKLCHAFIWTDGRYIPVEKEEILSKIDNIIRELSHLSSAQEKSSEAQMLKKEIDKEDERKLANLFEDLLVLLKDDPENKNMIREIWNRIMNGYGHVPVISEILKSVEKSFL
jgi:ribosomal protein RSM22 (predicted rRNA methylase)